MLPESVLGAVLSGSPWAVSIALAAALWARERRYDRQLAELVYEKDQLHAQLNGKIEALTDKYVKDMGAERETRLREARELNTEYGAAIGKVTGALETLKAVVQARREG